MLMNFATRAHNNNFALDADVPQDPIVRSLLDTDFYKLLMLQFIWKHYRNVRVSFALINRTKKVRLADEVDEVDEVELRKQLNYVRGLKFLRTELVWLQGETYYGQRNLFEPEFIEFLRNEFTLPDYALTKKDGQYVLKFRGSWLAVTMWEIYALTIVNELRTRSGLKKMSEFELDILYARAKARLWDKIEALRALPGLKLADFGTRRRHSFLWQEYTVTAMQAELGAAFTGTSNALIAFRHNLEAVGTNAHELPMVLTAIARVARTVGDNGAKVLAMWEKMYGPVLGAGDMKGAQYEVLRKWQDTYNGGLRVMLPDTFGTTQFLEDAPEFVNGWTGIRVDSKDPEVAGEEIIAWCAARGIDAKNFLLLFSDGLDVGDIVRLYNRFHGRVRLAFGWGTLLTNDFRDCHPRQLADLDPISLVCKVAEVGVPVNDNVPLSANDNDPGIVWVPAVKLSDNYTKATGPAEEVDYYRDEYGTRGVANLPVAV